MKLVILLTLLFLAAACGAGSNNANSADADELRADIIIRPPPNQPIIEITFYRDIADALNGKTNKGFEKNVVAVDNPIFNGAAMTNATNLSGQPFYKIDLGNPKASNVITATVNGKTFEASTMLEPRMVNKMVSVVMSPVEKSSENLDK